MNKDSFNVSISFKTDTALLNQIESTCQKHFMSRSELIRAGIRLMIQRLAKGNTVSSNTSDTDYMPLPSMIDQPVKQPSISIEENTATVVEVNELDRMFPPSRYRGFN